MKRGLKVLLSLVIGIFLLNFVSASFTVGNVTVEESYGPGEKLKGWLNISLQNEPTNSLLSAFESEISILDFLKSVGAVYSCFPVDCETGYATSGKETNKTFSLNFGGKKIIGLKVTGNIETISSFSMKIESTAGEDSYPQLFIDILNNNKIEWQTYKPSGNFLVENYGCYNSSDVTGEAEITQTEYCEKITIPFSSNVKIGAEVSEVGGKGGNVDFEMRIYNDENDASCTAAASGSGKISCIVGLTIKKEQDFFVCVRTKNSAGNNKYKINYEQNEPCGFSGEAEEYKYDFAIFAQQGKFVPVGSFVLNDAELENAGANINIESYIEDYIDDRYKNNCTNGCVIPIRFISGKQQTITISNVGLSYTAGISTTTKDIYDVGEENAKVNMEFQKLDLEKANLIVPASYGDKNLILELGEEEIISQKIKIATVPIISSVAPLNLPASMKVLFYVFASGNVTKYKWDFGDGATEETTENKTYHAYASIGNYELKIIAVNNFGESSKTFNIEVRSPKDEINRTLAEKKENIDEIKRQLEDVTDWYKEKIEKLIQVEEIETELKDLEKRYENALASDDSSEYAAIMSELLEKEVPSSIKSKIFSGAYLPNEDYINIDYLTQITGIKVEEPEKYKLSIINWINENVDINVKVKSYSLNYDAKQVPILTAISLKIKPKKDLEETYLIIDKSYDEITFKEDYNKKAIGDATAITFSELEEGKEETIELILPEIIEITELPLYLSTSFSQLPENGEIAPCDYDGKCEKEPGETAKNCPSDCTNWKKIIIWMAILLFGAFVVYIALQEWYKKYYESHLFKNKNDVFNLINFINNAENQGFSRGEIIKKLKEYGWRGEQIVYAYKKAKGKRTGMWEIPIFRAFEKKKLKKELEKRRQLGLYLPRQS